MATYYKYAERNVDSFINWAEIGKNITDTLQEENKLREQKKAEIDENSRKLGQQLAEAPTGKSRKMNEWTLKYADQAQKARLLQDKLLKAGRLNPKDYTVQRQNLSDGTNSLFTLSKEYQEEYARKMERMNAADPNQRSQALESFLMGTVEGFGNFNESEALINPTDYTVNVSMMKQNPKTGMYEPTGDIATVNSLRNRIKSEFNYFNSEAANKDIAGRLAKYVTAEIQRGRASKAGLVITTEDAMKRPGYQKALGDAIKSFLTNEYNISSVLTNDIGIEATTGKPFSFTFNPDEAKKDKSLILLETKNDMPVPKFTEDQKKAAELFMKGQIEQMIIYDKKINPYSEPQAPRPSAAEIEAGRGQKDKATLATAWNRVFTETDPEKKKAYLEQIVGMDQVIERGITDIKINVPKVNEGGTPGEYEIVFTNANPKLSRKITFDPSKTTAETWAGYGSEIHGIGDVKEAFRVSGGGDPSLVMGFERSSFEGVGAGRDATPTGDIDQMTLNYIDESFAKPLTIEDSPKQSAENLTRVLGKLGYSVKYSSSWFGGDEVKIKAPGQDEFITFNLDNGNADQEIKSFVIGSYSPTISKRALYSNIK